MANGIIFYEGPSELDAAPIMAVATGLKARRHNRKIGHMVQTWIMRADIAPHRAIHRGLDSSVCGNCRHRGKIVDGVNRARSCYVVVHQAPHSVWQTAAKGGYLRTNLADARAILAGLAIRLGAYGDPAAVPFNVWAEALADAARGTGYTHQWRTADPRFARYCMASADSPEEAAEAQALGYRTFRVGTTAERLARGEFLCPASGPAGHKVQCDSCLACNGTSAPNKASVFIPAHGAVSKVRAFERWRA